MPGFTTARRGSIASLLVIFMLIALVAVPLGIRSMKLISEWLLIKRADQYIQQVLPAAAAGLDPAGLAAGQVRLLTLSAHNMLLEHFQANLPEVFAGSLEVQSLKFTNRPVPYDPGHWLGDRQELSQPVVTLTAVLTLPGGRELALTHAVAIFLD